MSYLIWLTNGLKYCNQTQPTAAIPTIFLDYHMCSSEGTARGYDLLPRFVHPIVDDSWSYNKEQCRATEKKGPLEITEKDSVAITNNRERCHNPIFEQIIKIKYS